ncbi:heterocyst differentiation protein HetZ [cf. Phormidesmis sp. LEGE 11477]|uniref:heterocyst differentiation protein HetZ n=1 Tax=cf. Phormidesmis sp. LEGE 11477 TaxID=1828680 RepID=UPI001880850E|nr:heterocyst differentiation protein HetZ [cf. Phormidesmis sp. LEGE 11477]
MKTLFERLSQKLSEQTNASIRHCSEVARRIEKEARRVCAESQRIQNSGDIEGWASNLADIRLTQCLKYAKLGSTGGRIELHSSLSAIIYRYMTPPQVQSSYQARIALIEDFLQNFYAESINAFRRENEVTATYQPRSLLELAEYMAFTERYAKRRIHFSRGRSQQLIILRTQTFSKQQPPETAVDIQQTVEGTETEHGRTAPLQRLREELVTDETSNEGEETVRNQVVEQLMDYLIEKGQQDCADYFSLRLNDLPTHEIEDILQITPRERDYLQQRFKYHLLKFSFAHDWELVHEWLGAELWKNLGLTPCQWTHFQTEMNPVQAKILTLKQQRQSDQEISKQLNITATQLRKQWSNLLEKAWDIRNV